MIIGATRIATASGAGAVGTHVFSGPQNEAIELVQGTRADLDDMVRDAEVHGAKYAIRHYAISPEQAMSREQALEIVRDLGREFGFDPVRAVVVEHQKPRQDGAGHDRHWHALVPEVDPVRGRVLDAHWMRARHEKVSRVAELRLGHDQVSGRWNAAVARALRADGRDDLADRVAEMARGDRPRGAYTSDRRQIAQRQGRSMPEMKAAVADAWQRADSPRSFAAALTDQGLALRPGERPGVWIVEASGDDGQPVLVGAVDRLVRERRAAVAERLGALPDAPAPRQPDPEAHASRDDAGVAVDQISPDIQQHGEGPAPSAGEGETVRPAPAPRDVQGGGGSRAATAEADNDTIAPLDPSNPNDVARFLRQWAEHERKRLARLARLDGSKSHGGQHGYDPRAVAARLRQQWQHAYGAERARVFVDVVRRWQAQALDPAGSRRDPRRDSGSQADRGARPQGPDARVLRGDGGGAGGGRPVATAGPPRAAGRRELEDRPGARPAGADRRIADPAGAAAGRGRVAARRAERALAAVPAERIDRLRALSERLARGPEPVRQAPTPGPSPRDLIAAERQRLRDLIAARPEDPRELVSSALERPGRALDDARARVRDLTERLDRRPRGLLDRLGVGPAARERRQIERDLAEARTASEGAYDDYQADRSAAEAAAPHRARTNRDDNQRDRERLEALEAGLRAAQGGDLGAVAATRRGDVRQLVQVGREQLEVRRRREELERLARQEAAIRADRHHGRALSGHAPGRR
jgi:hypothetical protein